MHQWIWNLNKRKIAKENRDWLEMTLGVHIHKPRKPSLHLYISQRRSFIKKQLSVPRQTFQFQIDTDNYIINPNSYLSKCSGVN